MSAALIPPALAPLAYALMNIASATGIVFANKAVFAVFKFHFTYALTFIHTLFTMAGMQGFLQSGLFEPKVVPKHKLAPLAAAYVGYIVLCNLNLNLNPVGFYQITKIAVAPAVLAIDAVFYNKRASGQVTASVGVVCLGVGLATVTDPQISSNFVGMLVGFGSVVATALYQIWAGAKQKEFGLGSMQLLHQYVPLASAMLGGLVLMLEPMGWTHPTKDTIIGYPYAPGAVAAIILSAVLGLLVNLSTFLVIGATSSLTYNVVGHVKTVIILTGGVIFFGDSMSMKKLAGICVAFCGIIWYSHIKMTEGKAPVVLPKISVAPSGSADRLNGSLLSGGSEGGSGSRSPTRMRRAPSPAP